MVQDVQEASCVAVANRLNHPLLYYGSHYGKEFFCCDFDDVLFPRNVIFKDSLQTNTFPYESLDASISACHLYYQQLLDFYLSK